VRIKWISGTEYSDLLLSNKFSIIVVIPTHNEEEYTKKMIKTLNKAKSSLALNSPLHLDLSLEGKLDEYSLPVYFLKESDYPDEAENNFAGLIRVTSTGHFEHPVVSKRLKEGFAGSQLFDENGLELITSLITQTVMAKHAAESQAPEK